MHKETITFIDFDGNERAEDHYFNLTESDVVKMEMGTVGGYTKMINDIISAQDAPKIMSTFEEFVRKSYGKKSPDGRRFEKSEEISKEFMETNAYNKLFMRLCTDGGYAAKFVNAIIPKPDKSFIPAPADTNI